MEDNVALEYLTLLDNFVVLTNAHAIEKGRRFDRILFNGTTKFFVEKNTRKIFGAKSDFQYNPRREYGTLNTIDQMDWVTLFPIVGTQLFDEMAAREASIKSTYKQRGRPKKTP